MSDDEMWAPGWDEEPDQMPTTRPNGTTEKGNVEGATEENAFTDARLAETVATEALTRRYCRTELGWMQWDGTVWNRVDEGIAVEAVRQYALRRYTAALIGEQQRSAAGQSNDRSQIDGWYRVQSAGRIRAILSLAGNIEGVLRGIAEFDNNPDLLNTPDGVIDLATGDTRPHDPDLMMSKITKVRYVPGAHDTAFNAALEAIPGDSRAWLQMRLGQAITGHMPDDERAVLITGGGSNGKTTLMNTMFIALGGYAAAVPNTLLLTGRNPGGATPEKMTIRGVRLAYIEETPEGRYLDTQALKEVVGTPTITGRELYKGYVTYGATHSLFLNTNHLPRVAETDNGTWRRLVRVDFPYRYVPPGVARERDTDRQGDPTLKAKLADRRALEAALAWLIDGARAWYKGGKTLTGGDPEPVIAATLEWRHGSDIILRFLDDVTEFDRDAWVTGDGLYKAFCTWSTDHGTKSIPQNLFMDRLKQHTALPPYVTDAQVRSTRPGMSRPPMSLVMTSAVPDRTRAIIGLRYSE